MKWVSRRELFGLVGGAVGTGLLASKAWAAPFHCYLYRCPTVDMPVSLAVGTVRTEEFEVKHEYYYIAIQTQPRLPFPDMKCMLGVLFPWETDNCGDKPLLEAEWTLWDGGQVVAQGSAHGRQGDGAFSRDYVERDIGTFTGKSKRKYVLEVKFTKDASLLNETNPHLIVMMTRPTD
jgi:hypothetical protein